MPTWNYTSLQGRGKVELIENEAVIIQGMKELSKMSECNWPSGWEFFIPPDLATLGVLSKHVLGFRLVADEVKLKNKLSQTKSQEDRRSIIEGLLGREDSISHALGENMRRLHLAGVRA